MRGNERRFYPRTLLLAGGLLLVLAGCGGRPRPYPVLGRVVYRDGSPVLSGLVTFESTDAEKPATARGTIQQDGSFQLTTYKEGDGAVPAHYRVMISSIRPPPPHLESRVKAAPPSPIDGRYSRFEKSGLECTVQPGSNEVTFTVDKPTSRSMLSKDKSR